MADERAPAASRVRLPNGPARSPSGAIAEGVPPLEYMLAVMRDEQAEAHRRDEMAKAAAPYIHPRLATIEQRPAQERAPTIAERVAEYDREDAIVTSDGKVVALRAGQ